MTDLFLYLIEATVISGILFLGYIVFLKNQPKASKRIALLMCIICSSSFPLIELSLSQTKAPNFMLLTAETIEPGIDQNAGKISTIHMPEKREPIITSNISAQPEAKLDFMYLFGVAYFIVLGLLLLRFIISIASVFRLKYKSVNKGEYYEVNRSDFKGASFFGWVFIGNNIGSGFDMVFAHEKSHVNQFHSVDKLLAELFCCIFWFNPFAFVIKRSIELNLEMDADSRVIAAFHKDRYTELLVGLSISNYPLSLLKFSAHSLKRRLRSIHESQNRRQFTSSSLLFLAITLASFWLFSCVDATEDVVRFSKNVIANTAVKSVSTTFISHQYDTKAKDDRIIAEAHFLPDGSLDYAKQHMTYPYNYEKPVPKEYWTTPSSDGLLHTLDGLSLSQAENNLLYGNDWPAHYATMKEQSKTKDNYYREEVTTRYGNNNLPSEIDYNRYLLINENSTVDLTEKFEYDNKKVVRFYKERPYTWTLTTNKDVEATRSDVPSISDDYSFEYIDDQLTRLSHGNKVLNFKYDKEGRLISSTYEINGQVYNTRKYYYDEQGLKTRTEIFNVDQQPEYTILYNYEFFSK